MFKRVLIANRGEIAIRIIRACQELGVETVAVYSSADADAVHVKLADQAINIGPADATRSYLNVAAILDAAQLAEVDAIHPGYGFLSENADFAEAVIKAGFVFVGPRPETIRKVGNKDAARELMKQAGLPMALGSDPVHSLEEAVSTAAKIGYPVIIKPIAGGGGKSMFVAQNEADIHTAALKIDFTTAGFYLEKYIANARHIEVQIVADNYGDIIHLGERECSIQRRNQKILEEAPSCVITPEMRQKVGALAIRAAKSANYTNIGTVEFLMDKNTCEFYFMEINPRIQVEHAITEITTGVDLVKTQLRIAAGDPLPIRQEYMKFNCHAIECRINAEDPDNFFLPSPGEITFYHQPGGPNVRVDDGVCTGSIVQPYYDSMIAKIITCGRTRGDAIKTMRRALSEFRIVGVKTTIDFHRKLLDNPYFCSGDIDTQFIAKRMTPSSED
ncbi:acetyl-CoA carboxylase biotin carboxylase subunit [Propionispora hippei]|uniref:biotin carboxylase n=1 Tax=Propionispora hippei DSM 15287 TaxID=1123003 RepID=A0A1M6FKI8_9FIRM|nr:acetyl-CoA carboxylase biotin carboxylase subunit [Propionispora hippei]SHI98173.1 acetyl-CoA carboxylase, biotin carboxylase subunit [Propionispora hippei DSM 15287]